MARPTHRVHRWRIISRCPTCAGRLLSGCSYRACIATRDDRPKVGKRRVHVCGPTRSATIDLAREARRIFDVKPALGELDL